MSARPLRRICYGLYSTRAGDYTIGRMESEGVWQIWAGDDEWPAFGQAFRTLRDAVERIESESS